MANPLIASAVGAMTATGALVWPVGKPSRLRAVRLHSLSGAPPDAADSLRHPCQFISLSTFARLARRTSREDRVAWLGSARLTHVLLIGTLLGVVAWSACDAPVLVPLTVTLAVWVNRRTRRAFALRAEARRRREVVDLCTVLRTELVAGRSSTAALSEASAACPAVAGAGECGRYGGEPVAALRRAAETPGYEGLRALAACWQVAATSGTGLVPAVTRVECALREELRDRAELDAELGGVRATAALLAGLPLLAIGLGGIAGGDPLRILLHTSAGGVCLFAGVLLELAGVTWVDHIAARTLRIAMGVMP